MENRSREAFIEPKRLTDSTLKFKPLSKPVDTDLEVTLSACAERLTKVELKNGFIILMNE